MWGIPTHPKKIPCSSAWHNLSQRSCVCIKFTKMRAVGYCDKGKKHLSLIIAGKCCSIIKSYCDIKIYLFYSQILWVKTQNLVGLKENSRIKMSKIHKRYYILSKPGIFVLKKIRLSLFNANTCSGILRYDIRNICRYNSVER